MLLCFFSASKDLGRVRCRSKTRKLVWASTPGRPRPRGATTCLRGKLPKTPLGYYWPKTQRGTQPRGRPHGPLPRGAAGGGGQARRRSQGGKPRSIVPESGLGLGAKGGPYAWSPPPGPVQAGPGRPQACGPGNDCPAKALWATQEAGPKSFYGATEVRWRPRRISQSSGLLLGNMVRRHQV